MAARIESFLIRIHRAIAKRYISKMENLNYTSSVSETVRDLELEIYNVRIRDADLIGSLKNKVQNLEEALNVLIVSNNLYFNSSRPPTGIDANLLLKSKTAPNTEKALSVVRNVLADDLQLDNELIERIRSAEPHKEHDILFDAGTILNKVRILARLHSLGATGGVIIQDNN